MPNRPEYPSVPLPARAAYGLFATVTGVGLLAAVVAAFQAPLPEALAGVAVAEGPACAQPSAAAVACRTTLQPTIVAAR